MLPNILWSCMYDFKFSNLHNDMVYGIMNYGISSNKKSHC